MEPVWMILAESAAEAAVLALQRGCSVQEIEVHELQQRLEVAGQILRV
jgi:cobalamin biosynthesis protein CbiD